MIWLREVIDNPINIITEKVNGEKSLFIEGIFMQSDVKNKNKRVYPKDIMESEVNRYYTECIKENRAMGELGHPQGPTVNLDRVSHIIVDLKGSGNDYYGKAKIVKTPCGQIAEALLESGAKLGVSSRGFGSVRTQNDISYVQNDFKLHAIDIVADPSAPNAFVNSIMEGKEWVWDNGIIREAVIDEYKKKIKKTPAKKLDEAKLDIFSNFLNSISKIRKH